jgi:poly(A) polymerase
MMHDRCMVSNPYNVAKQICKRLFDEGYIAYFAGGWVRDLILKQSTDEIDIATSAPPEKIQALFQKTVGVGISFGVVIVVLEGMHFEVTTFRKDHAYTDGRHPDKVDFSTPEKDALRRDFTINGMFYDPLTESVYDYVEGQKDLKRKVIRAIGDPYTRFAEDRLRMIRAIRFAARFQFQIEKATGDAIKEHASRLFPSISMERIWQEFCKMANYHHIDQAFLMLHEFGLLPVIFPKLCETSSKDMQKIVESFLYYPPNTPAIIYMLALFPNDDLEDRRKLCMHLKTPTADRKLAEFFTESEKLFAGEKPESYIWAHFYAHPYSDLFLRVYAARLSPLARIQFLQEHEKRHFDLQTHIVRLRQKTPLVNATRLKQEGISAGILLGKLLKEAEKMAINDNLSSSEAVLKRLKLHPAWPKDSTQDQPNEN